MNNNNEKHFSRRLNIQVCELTSTNKSSHWKVLLKVSDLGILEDNK